VESFIQIPPLNRVISCRAAKQMLTDGRTAGRATGKRNALHPPRIVGGGINDTSIIIDHHHHQLNRCERQTINSSALLRVVRPTSADC